MGKMWKILEDYSPDFEGGMGYRHGMEGDGYEEGFEEGCEHGYRKAMKEMRMMGMRGGQSNGNGNGYTRTGNAGNYRYPMGGYMPPYPSFRDDDDDDYEMQQRRRRDSRGRYM